MAGYWGIHSMVPAHVDNRKGCRVVLVRDPNRQPTTEAERQARASQTVAGMRSMGAS